MEKQSSDKRILAIDSTILTALQTCEFYTFLNFVKNYRPNEIKEPLERGDLGHKVAEKFYSCIKAGIDFETALDAASTIGREIYQELNIPIEICEWTINSFQRYARFYRYDGLQILEVEKAFILKIYENDELEIHYTGKVDIQAIIPSTGKAPVDHKFRTRKVNELILNNQLTGYAIATKSEVAMMNEIGLQKSLKDEERFRRTLLHFPKGFKERWLKNTVLWAKQLDDCLQDNRWKQTFSSCLKYNKPCIFHKVCESENEEEMKRKIKEYYHEGEQWDVTSALELED